MSVNLYKPHLLVRPEDDANRQIANGFILEIPDKNIRRIQVLPVAGGWRKVVDQFLEEDVPGLERFDRRFLILLIDLDDDLERVKAVQARIPAHLTDRVFVLGVLSEPEKLRQAGLGSFEEIGQQLARECRDGIGAAWNHELLGHNIGELERLRTRVGPLLWGP